MFCTFNVLQEIVEVRHRTYRKYISLYSLRTRAIKLCSSFMLSRASCCCNVVRNPAQPAGLICQQLKTLKTINKSVLYNIIYGKNMNNSQTMTTCDLYVWLIQYLYCNCFEYLEGKKKENCHVEASRMMKVSEHYARHAVILNSVFGLKRLEHLTTLWFAESQLYFLSHLRCW